MTKILPGTTVLDFDGTITDAQEEAKPAIKSYKQRLASKIGIDISKLVKMLAKARQKVLARPGFYGWEYNNLTVAPAVSDPYLLHQVSVSLVIESLRKDSRSLTLPSKEEMPDFLNMMHKLSYSDSAVCFKPKAAAFIRELQSIGELAVVTNSQTQDVMHKLDLLLGKGHGVKLIGNAKKYLVDSSWLDVDESVLPTKDFPRPVFLRRHQYYEVLSSLKNVQRVVGDIYELDLALPEHLGITTVLVANSMTPSWERDYYQAHPNGFVIDGLEKIIPELLAR